MTSGKVILIPTVLHEDADNSIPSADKFVSMALSDLEQLHTGSIIGLGITEKMFTDWKLQR